MPLALYAGTHREAEFKGALACPRVAFPLARALKDCSYLGVTPPRSSIPGIACLAVLAVLSCSTIAAAQQQTAGAPPTAPTSSTNQCKRGVELESLGRTTEAASAYVKGIATSDLCSRRLEALQRSDGLCAEGDALEDLGRGNEANAAYRKVLASVPESECARLGVDDTDPASFWSWLGTATADFGTAILALGLALLVAALILLILLWIAVRVPGTRSLPVIRRLCRPFVDITTLDDSALGDDKLGPSTTALLRARIASGAGANGLVDLAAGEASASQALAGLGEASGQAKAVVALIQMISSAVRPSQWEAAGEMHAEGDRGRGLTLSLTSTNTYEDFAAFWTQTDAGPALGDSSKSEPYARLTVPAAAWVRHRVAEDLDPDKLATQDPRSYALFEAGLYWQEHGVRDAARALYERALTLDDRNTGALANLGVMEAEDGDTDRADELLTRALDLLEQ